MTGPAWDRVARVVMSTLHEPRPVEWTVEEIEPRAEHRRNALAGLDLREGSGIELRVFRYIYWRRG